MGVVDDELGEVDVVDVLEELDSFDELVSFEELAFPPSFEVEVELLSLAAVSFDVLLSLPPLAFSLDVSVPLLERLLLGSFILSE